ncbi:MAG: ABC transporter permease [Prevotella sp.]|nr:ABC transporter permease [Prevotella sp.]
MDLQDTIQRTVDVALRECNRLKRNHIYLFCMVILPLIVIIFFTSLMGSGQPVDMPVGIVDNDNTPTSRSLIRQLDGFQASKVVAYYPNVAEARSAIQRNKIYAFLYIPHGTTADLLAMRQPKISFYYSSTSITAGALLFKDLKTVSTLGSAAVGASLLSAKGLAEEQVMAFLQPIVTELHPINNPSVNYNVYLSTMLIPGCLMLFIFILTPYSIGTELKFNTSKELLDRAGGNIYIAMVGKLLPQTLIFLAITYIYMFYVFGILNFPHPGGICMILLLGLLSVLAAQGFGMFMFGLVPSLRMSMSICSLWAVLSFSLAGTAFPVPEMDSEIQALALLFPLRHYYMVYQLGIFNGYSLSYTIPYIAALIVFAALPLLVFWRIRKALTEFVYIP